MAEDKFYSNYACTLVSCWPTIPKLVNDFSLHEPQKTSQRLFDNVITAKQLIQAHEESYELVQESLFSYVEWQKSVNLSHEKRQVIASDMELLAKNVKIVATQKNSKQKDAAAKIDEQFKQIRQQQILPEEYAKKIDLWRIGQLDVLIKEWQCNWATHKQQFVNELQTKLKEKLNLELNENEANEILQPMRTRDELIRDLVSYFPSKLPKGCKKSSDIFTLRCFWAVGSCLKRTMTSGGKDGDSGQALSVAEIITASAKKAAKKQIDNQRRAFKAARKKLLEIKQQLLDQEIGLSKSARKQQSRIIAKAAKAKASEKEELLIVEPE